MTTRGSADGPPAAPSPRTARAHTASDRIFIECPSSESAGIEAARRDRAVTVRHTVVTRRRHATRRRRGQEERLASRVGVLGAVGLATMIAGCSGTSGGPAASPPPADAVVVRVSYGSEK